MTAVDLIHSNGRARPQSGAAVQAHSKLAQICHSLAAEPLETMDETLRHCMPFVEEMVTLGLVERADAADQIWNALVASGLVQQRGADAVQCILANGLTRKEHESVERGAGGSGKEVATREAADRAWAELDQDGTETFLA